MQALLNIYLLEEPDLMTKHLIVLYVLLDLISLADTATHERFASKIAKFTKAFNVPIAFIKQIQGFWLLDHKDFEVGNVYREFFTAENFVENDDWKVC